jgi:peptidoglycan/xylan/chitin deacetylase (PgdA/CDA1 family)
MRGEHAWLRRRPRTIIALALLGLLLATALALFQISRARCFSLVGEAICHVETREPLVALSFDDGPTPQGVAYATAVLRPAGAHATFFLIGSQIPGQEALVRRLLAEGDEVGNHSFSHERMAFHSSAFYEDEIMRTDALLRAAGVPAPDLFRPPYGKKLIGLPLALDRHGYRMIMWDVEDPPEAATPQAYADAVVREARPGSIILMHIMYSTNRIARDALPLVVRGLQARGLRIVTVGELLRHGA